MRRPRTGATAPCESDRSQTPHAPCEIQASVAPVRATVTPTPYVHVGPIGPVGHRRAPVGRRLGDESTTTGADVTRRPVTPTTTAATRCVDPVTTAPYPTSDARGAAPTPGVSDRRGGGATGSFPEPPSLRAASQPVPSAPSTTTHNGAN